MVNGIHKKKKTALMALMVVAFVMLQILVTVMDRSRASSYKGVVLAGQFVACLVLVRINYRTGAIISYIMMGYAIINMSIVMMIRHILEPLPGVCNMLIYAVSLALLSRQFRIRDRAAVTDVLTGLLNRRGLFEELSTRVGNEKPFYLIYIDLGNFKLINDNYGHTYGDDLMRLVTDRMSAIVGKNGVLTRLGGDEYVLLLNGECDVADIAEQIVEKLCEKASIISNGARIDSYLTAFAGISRFPEDSTDAEELIKYADIAMYQAAREKTRKICFFDKNMEAHFQREMELEKLIKEGLKEDYFYLVYQPQYKLEGKELRGFEALLRMRVPGGKMVSPAEFIPVAEKGDLVLQIDDYVLRRAMREFKDIVEKKGNLTISVNVSAKNISSKGFALKVQNIIEETGFRAENLEIEITEYCMVQSVDLTIENIEELRKMGVQVALDDFGTGYTSLSYLAKMPINLLKVDKSLVDDIVEDEKSRDFVTAVIAMGHLMGCEVISEGVENKEQLEVLSSQECDFVQGYVWGRPLEYDAAAKLTKEA